MHRSGRRRHLSLSAKTRGLSSVPGILTTGIHSGIKRAPELDLALIFSTHETTAAGVFTTNRCTAAPVDITRRHIRAGKVRAIICNSGNANACTGQRGLSDALAMAHATAEALDLKPNQVCVGSTGIIGKPLPIQRIQKAVPGLVSRLKPSGGRNAARAILTTDAHIKEASTTATISGKRVTIGGIAKGAGMIHPNMATMLGYLATDAEIERTALESALKFAVGESFNAVSIDGETSTNDMVLCLANGLANNSRIRLGTAAMRAFQRLLTEVCLNLAKQICHDGEGTTKVIQVVVNRARTRRDAKKMAMVVGTSTLFKTAMFGQDPNWGRIMAAIGRSNIAIKPDRISLAFDTVTVVKKGIGTGIASDRAAKKVLRQKEFTLTIDLGLGRAHDRIWTTDLSPAYVALNAHYST
ncbi:MAG TPA: bifunctional glutamate N-acetyltransferase/amino-acid acetyltransferase ArgJ [Nitrospirales bacterium]|nr:bifunctional glutamate N-acetyltransferase/amino-acid acetyltransferase ArgJ [Nitrospirales bacterium]